MPSRCLRILGAADRIGVYPGHSCPMVAPLVTAPQFHGETGLDGPVLPEPTHAAQNKHAVDFIVDTVMSTDDVTLIATGPLTNIASAINREPRIVERVKELCIMGGSVTYGNWTPAAEFNIFVDPEAASRVFNSGMHVEDDWHQPDPSMRADRQARSQVPVRSVPRPRTWPPI